MTRSDQSAATNWRHAIEFMSHGFYNMAALAGAKLERQPRSHFMKKPAGIKTALLCLVFCVAFSPVVWAGYDVHITRAKEWTESKKTPIPLDDWIQYVKNDAEFRVVLGGVG